MAKGYPDYFGQSIWPKYGTMFIELDSVDTSDASETTVVEKTGPGVWTSYFGVISSLGAATTFTIRLYVDGVLLALYPSASLFTCGYNQGPSQPLHVSLSRESDFLLHLSLSHDIPFQASFKLTIQRGGAINLTTDYRIGWYKVQ